MPIIRGFDGHATLCPSYKNSESRLESVPLGAVITLPKVGTTHPRPVALTWRSFAGILREISPRYIGLGQSGLGDHYINVMSGHTMGKRKTPKSCFVLKEESGVVEASLTDENDLSLQHTIYDMPHPRVVAPRRTKAQIEEDSKFLAACDHEPQSEFLKKNIAAMNQEINRQVQEIRKALKRMQSYAHYVITAKEIINELESTHNK